MQMQYTCMDPVILLLEVAEFCIIGYSRCSHRLCYWRTAQLAIKKLRMEIQMDTIHANQFKGLNFDTSVILRAAPNSSAYLKLKRATVQYDPTLH